MCTCTGLNRFVIHSQRNTSPVNMYNCRTSLAPNTSAKGKVLFPNGSDVPVTAFLGLPYAQPPVGELRFCPPQPQELWTGERDCTQFGVICPQPWVMSKTVHEQFGFPVPENMSEDCLYLNVYSPNLKPEARRPVMVWIHGGAFCLGTAFSVDGTVLAGLHDVVVVTLNYRLGALGFLTTGDDVIPGNNGLLDQVEALKWVQQHIAAFGGDPDNVTIFGESAGGFSCSLHVVSELTTGLFHRAIIMSGPGTSPYAALPQQKVRELIQPQLQALGYQGSSSKELNEFLRSKTATELGDLGVAMFHYKPVIDGHYLKDYPHKLYEAGKFEKVELISGCVSHEGCNILSILFPTPDFSTTEESLRKSVRQVVDFFYFTNQEALVDALYKRYITAGSSPDAARIMFAEMYAHLMFVGHNNSMALKHSEGAPVYVYNYAHRRSTSKSAAWVASTHGEDLFPLFGCPLTETTSSDEDKKVSKDLMAYWTNFAKNGNPNGLELKKWLPFTKDSKNYIILKAEAEVANDYEPEHMEFWEKEMPKIAHRD